MAELDAERKATDKWIDAKRNVESADAESTDLRPFHKDDGSYWRSNDVRDTVALGYTYPLLDKYDERVMVNGVYDEKKHRALIVEYLNKTYNSAAAAATKAALTANPGESNRPRLMKLSSLLATVSKPVDVLNQTVNDYAVNVIYEK